MTAGELNDAIRTGEIGELIRVAESRQRKRLSKIADAICARDGVRLILLAGASAAGKTTTAKRLATQLRVNERTVLSLSTDDYFVGDDETPKDENGELDYEHVECVDIPALVRDLSALFRGESIPVRRFDFVHHLPVVTEKTLSLPANGYVILEGIHALNPRLTVGIAEAQKYRVFVEPQPSLEVFLDLKQKPSGARFLRRMVRDNTFRKLDPATTVKLWPKVLAGEEKWIEPFVAGADATFDSYLVYELAVLKPFVGGLLEKARRTLGELPEIVKMIRLLELVKQVEPTLVPGDSIIRETIGGSQLEY